MSDYMSFKAVLVVGGFLIALGLCQCSLIAYAFLRTKKVCREAGNELVARVPLCLRQPVCFKYSGLFALFLGMQFLCMWEYFNIGGLLVCLAAVFFLLPMFAWFKSKRGPSYVEIRDRGVIIGGTELKPWSSIRRYRWHGTGPVHLKLYFPNVILELPFRDEDQQTVQRAFATYYDQVQCSHLDC